MKFINRYIHITVVAVLVVLLAGCERTELCYDHYPRVAVTLDWEQAWERDYGMAYSANWQADHYGFDYSALRPDAPEWVNLVKYSDNAPVEEYYFSPTGGDVLFKEFGDYSFLVYNGDTEYILLSDLGYLPNARATATPRSRSTISYVMERHPGTKSVNPPDVLYSGFMEEVPQVGYHQVVPVSVKMHPIVFTYVVRFEFEYGIQHVRLARGALGGMAESVYLLDGRTSEESIIILYDCDVTDYGCEAHVQSFGVPGLPANYMSLSADDIPDRPYTLNLEVMLTSGKTLEFNFDVDEQLRKQPRGGVITVSGIRIEDEQNVTQTSGDAFDVGLSGWGEEHVDLPINNE